MKLIFRIVGYFLATASAVTVIWGVATYFNKSETRTQHIENSLETIIETQQSESVKTDSLMFNVNRLNRNVNDLTGSHNALRESYVNYLSHDDALTKEEFIDYMQGIEFEIKKNDRSEIASDKLIR